MLKFGLKVKGTGWNDREWTGIVIKMNRKTFWVARDGDAAPVRCEVANRVPPGVDPATWPLGFSGPVAIRAAERA